MASVEKPSDIPPDAMADMEEVCRLIAEGKRVTDPRLLRRIYDRSYSRSPAPNPGEVRRGGVGG